jgi:hypothetical protein
VSQPGAGTALHGRWLLKCVCNSLRQTQRRCWLQMAGCGLGDARHHGIDCLTLAPLTPRPSVTHERCDV